MVFSVHKVVNISLCAENQNIGLDIYQCVLLDRKRPRKQNNNTIQDIQALKRGVKIIIGNFPEFPSSCHRWTGDGCKCK